MDKISEDIRLLIAFTLSILIILVFSKIYVKKSPVQEYQKQQLDRKITEEKEIKKEVKQIQEGEIFEFENKDYYLKLDKKIGYIKEIGLKKFLRKGEKFFPLNEGAILFYNPEISLENDFDLKIENSNEIYLSKGTSDFYCQKKLFVPENDYFLQYEENIKNKVDKDIQLKDYKIEVLKIDLENIKKQRGYIPPKIIAGINRLPVFIDPYKIKEKKIYKSCNWVGYSSRYSLIFIYLPEKSTVIIDPDSKFINLDLLIENLNLKGGEEKTYKFKFYAGPSDYFVAKNYIKQEIFGKGFFTIIGRFLFIILNAIHKIFPNWGWAIIILTFIVKIVFFPLTRKSLYSMKQLQRLRPYLQDIQKKYKDNPYQLQKELMNIYKEYNINPFAGCLPTIIQIPIFVGFFLALRNSIFLRGAPFILWIKDLSMPDTVLKINGIPVNILPILMTITSYFQQKLTPQTDPNQKSLTIIMPLMFLFILYNFPSGLLLYWVTMNIASLIEQYIISKNTLKIKLKK
jgi:YidC/Oxa1 family membrane protein insertase